MLQPEVVEWLADAVVWARGALPKAKAKAKRQAAQVVKLANIGVIGVGKSSSANLLLGTGMPEGLGRTTAGLESDMMRGLTGLWTTAGGQVFETHLLDTQGIGHDKGHDEELYLKLKDRYSNEAEINAVLFYVNGQSPTLTADMRQGLTEYFKIFGKALENNFAIVFTKCAVVEGDTLDDLKAALQEWCHDEFDENGLPHPARRSLSTRCRTRSTAR